MNGKAIGLLGIFSSFSQIFNSVYGSLHLVDDPFFFYSFSLQVSLGHIRELI